MAIKQHDRFTLSLKHETVVDDNIDGCIYATMLAEPHYIARIDIFDKELSEIDILDALYILYDRLKLEIYKRKKKNK